MIPYAKLAKKMSMEDKILRKFQAKSALLTMLLVGFVALFSVGCGDSRDEFVATNSNGGTGTLVFRFQQAVLQAVDTVPAGTTQLVFSLHAGAPASTANLVEVRGPVAFQNVVTLTGVPTNVTHVVVTALGANNQPLAILTGDVFVQAGVTTDVDLNDSTPVTFDAITVSPDPINLVVGGAGVQASISGAFSNGSNVNLPINNSTTTFSFAPDNGVANFSATGLFQGLQAGNSTATATYTLGGVSRSDTFLVRVYEFEADVTTPPAELVSGGNYTAGYTLNLTRADLTTRDNFTSAVTYAISPDVNGLSIDANTGDITNNGSVTSGTFNVVVTVTDSVSGLTFTDTIPFTVVSST